MDILYFYLGLEEDFLADVGTEWCLKKSLPIL